MAVVAKLLDSNAIVQILPEKLKDKKRCQGYQFIRRRYIRFCPQVPWLFSGEVMLRKSLMLVVMGWCSSKTWIYDSLKNSVFSRQWIRYNRTVFNIAILPKFRVYSQS